MPTSLFWLQNLALSNKLLPCLKKYIFSLSLNSPSKAENLDKTWRCPFGLVLWRVGCVIVEFAVTRGLVNISRVDRQLCFSSSVLFPSTGDRQKI